MYYLESETVLVYIFTLYKNRDIDDFFNSGYYYIIESEKRVILQSMAHWEECTCIRFREKTSSDIYSIMFMSSGNG